MKKDIVKIMLEQWSWYAPNMTEENLIEAHITTPMDVQMRNINMPQGGWSMEDTIASQFGRMRPFPEIANYRLPVKNLYFGLCSNTLQAGDRKRKISHTCCKVIAEDLGLPKIWEQKGRPY